MSPETQRLLGIIAAALLSLASTLATVMASRKPLGKVNDKLDGAHASMGALTKAFRQLRKEVHEQRQEVHEQRQEVRSLAAQHQQHAAELAALKQRRRRRSPRGPRVARSLHHQ